jgi:hypothetical protein
MKKSNLDPEKKVQLEKEFKELGTIEDKFNFWLEKLKLRYCLWLNKPLEEYKVFKIIPENDQEIEKLNTLSLNQYKEIDRMFTPAQKILEFEELKSNFFKKREETANQKNYIEYEIKKIENLVIEKENSKEPFEEELNNFFLFGYKEYYLNNKAPDLKRRVFCIENLLEWFNGYVIAQYHQFLNVSLKKPVEKDQFLHIVQMLILDYLGVGKRIENNSQKAEIYAALIRRDSETTRQYFSKLNDRELAKTAKNLNIILDFFKKAGLPDQIELVKKDIERYGYNKDEQNMS